MNSRADVLLRGISDTPGDIGGLVGRNSGSDSRIINSYARGDIDWSCHLWVASPA